MKNLITYNIRKALIEIGYEYEPDKYLTNENINIPITFPGIGRCRTRLITSPASHTPNIINNCRSILIEYMPFLSASALILNSFSLIRCSKPKKYDKLYAI